ncbi:MAG: sugar transferase [Chloroflexaceae bacterium]|nr:sugar transferase [Chloroflexaceae bacterium]NJO05052.1 sugar transferase [Chloroflexaceae bacterium]
MIVTRSHVITGKATLKEMASYLLKRAFDIVAASMLLLVLLPILLLIAFLIRHDSAGSPLFIQQRVGSRRRVRNGKVVWEVRNFPCFKFRTMYTNADQKLHQEHVKKFVRGELEAGEQGADTAKFKLDRDPRITRIGHILRRTSLDELPQLLNVLRGEMSLIGPRPVPTYEVAEYDTWHFLRLAALPGISGLWQVKGRSQVSFEEMVELDVEYVRQQSLLFDIKIMLLTVLVMINGSGAR